MAGGKIKREKGKPQQHTPYQGGISFHISKGQHILKNPLHVDSIVQKSAIKSTDVILEIGPGLVISQRSFWKLARWLLLLRLTHVWFLSCKGDSRVIQGDVLRTELPYFDICVANFPYQISSPLTFKLLNHQPAFRCDIIMFQREFAMRLVALPGSIVVLL